MTKRNALGDGWKMPGQLDCTMAVAHEGWLADMWLLIGERVEPDTDGFLLLEHLGSEHDKTNAWKREIRYVTFDGERYDERNRDELRRAVVERCTSAVHVRTTWTALVRDDRDDEIPRDVRVVLQTADPTREGYHLYGAESASRDGLAGRPALRTFRAGEDETNPNDATVDVECGIRADDVLTWLAEAAYATARTEPN